MEMIQNGMEPRKIVEETSETGRVTEQVNRKYLLGSQVWKRSLKVQ
jgi:hypothetical protein